MKVLALIFQDKYDFCVRVCVCAILKVSFLVMSDTMCVISVCVGRYLLARFAI